MDYFINWIVIPVFFVLLISMLVLLFVFVPVGLHAQRACLEAGFPKSDVTYNLDIYCMNLDGSVTVRVQKQ
jgi:hypothetical protein